MDSHSTSDILDDSVMALKAAASPWMGVLWLCVLPLRLLTLYMFRVAISLGDDATQYGNYFWTLSAVAVVLFVISVYGRLLFVKNIYANLESDHPVKSKSFKVSLSELFVSIYVLLFLEMLFYGSLWSLFIPFIVLVFSGVAIPSIHQNAKMGALKPFKALVGQFANAKTLLKIVIIFLIAAPIAFIGSGVLLQLFSWLIQGFVGSGAEVITKVLEPSMLFFVTKNVLVIELQLLFVLLLLEPFWLAAFTSMVYRFRMQSSGDDLRRRFNKLKKEQL